MNRSNADDLLPVLFLDIDDVLCLNETHGGYDAIEALNDRHPDPAAVYSGLFAQGARDVLRRVHEAMAGRLRYVISSTWREHLSHEQMSEMFRRVGLGVVAGSLEDPDRWCTPAPHGLSRRVDDIAAWLDRHHRGEPFAILDDDYSGASLLPAMSLPLHPFHGRVVLCQERVGLLERHARPLLNALARSASLPNL